MGLNSIQLQQYLSQSHLVFVTTQYQNCFNERHDNIESRFYDIFLTKKPSRPFSDKLIAHKPIKTKGFFF